MRISGIIAQILPVVPVAIIIFQTAKVKPSMFMVLILIIAETILVFIFEKTRAALSLRWAILSLVVKKLTPLP